LIVRKLDDPLPGKIRDPASDRHLRRGWQRATEDAIARAYQRAQRPADGPVPAQAVAVVFADAAELLACLAIDLARCQWGEHWWWNFARKIELLDAVPALECLFLQHVRLMPAVCSYLLRSGSASDVFRAIEPHAAIDLLAALGVAHDSRAIQCVALQWKAALRTTRAPPPMSRSQEAAEPAGDVVRHGVSSGERHKGPQPLPWQSSLPLGNIPGDLAPPQQCLLAAATLLHVNPRLARSPSFGGSLNRWMASGWNLPNADPFVQDSPLVKEPRSSVPAQTHVTEVSNASSAPSPEVAASDTGQVTGSDTRATQGRHSIGRPQHPDEHPAAINSLVSRHTFPNRDEDNSSPDSNSASSDVIERDKVARSIRKSVAKHAPGADVATTPASSTEQHAMFCEDRGEFTQAGGVLYLIHLLRELELPECFSAPWRLASRISSWATLELVARALLGRRLPALCRDPIWAALARLDGRQPETLPQASLDTHLPFHLPESWYDRVATGDDRFCWAANDHQLCLWCHAGYLLAEVPRGPGDAEIQAMRLLNRYLPARPGLLAAASYQAVPRADVTELRHEGLEPGLTRWLSIVTPYLRRRLRWALDDERDEALIAVLCCPGHLFVSATHVDFVTALEQISVPVRLAGLDRDPGWLPTFQRVVLFHFQ
jgi:hypothetical protein